MRWISRTTFYSPQIDVDGNVVWDQSAAHADLAGGDLVSCGVVTAAGATGKFGEGDLVCGAVEIRDARRNIREEAPDVIQTVRVLDLSDEIPNDTMSYSPDFPADLAATIHAGDLRFRRQRPGELRSSVPRLLMAPGVAETI